MPARFDLNSPRKIPDDGEASVAVYNTELQGLADDNRNTWFTAPWLFAECVMSTFQTK